MYRLAGLFNDDEYHCEVVNGSLSLTVQAYAGQLFCQDLVVPSIYTYIKICLPY